MLLMFTLVVIIFADLLLQTVILNPMLLKYKPRISLFSWNIPKDSGLRHTRQFPWDVSCVHFKVTPFTLFFTIIILMCHSRKGKTIAMIQRSFSRCIMWRRCWECKHRLFFSGDIIWLNIMVATWHYIFVKTYIILQHGWTLLYAN